MKSLMELTGPAKWAELHGHPPRGKTIDDLHSPTELVGGFCDSLVCGHCGMGCKKLMSGMHDLKNAQLGKKIQFADNFREVQRNYANPYHTCIGICPEQRCSGRRCKPH